MPVKILKKNFSKMNNNWLHSRYVLYFIFVIALGKFFFLLNSGDYYYASIFVLVGLLTSFFNKNMIIILFIALSLTSILELGSKSAVHEGFKDDDDEGFEDEEEEGMKTKDKSKTKSKKDKAEGMDNEESDESSIEKNIEGLKEVKDNIYSDLQDINTKTTKHLDVDKNMKDTDKLLVAQDKLLHNMDKYKSLLDTLQGITQNMSILKTSA